MSMLGDALGIWREQFDDGLAAVGLYSKAQDGAPGGDGSASLVAWPRDAGSIELVFVQWTDPGVRGRVADVTDDHFLKCIVPVGQKKNSH